jgi:hypothetical protein
VQIRQVGFQVIQAAALSRVIGKFIEIADPVFAILPIGEADVFHDKVKMRDLAGPSNPGRAVFDANLNGQTLDK